MNSNLAEWAYILGCVTAVAALIFRSLFFFAIAPGVWICENVGIKPSTLLLFQRVVLRVFDCHARAVKAPAGISNLTENVGYRESARRDTRASRAML